MSTDEAPRANENTHDEPLPNAPAPAETAAKLSETKDLTEAKPMEAPSSGAQQQQLQGKGGKFPLRLMRILNDESNASIIEWLPHGKAFLIKDKKRFEKELLPKHFKASKFTSFTRRLTRSNFRLVKHGPEAGAYYHPQFRKGDTRMCQQITCKNSKASLSIHQPMNMPSMSPIAPSPPVENHFHQQQMMISNAPRSPIRERVQEQRQWPNQQEYMLQQLLVATNQNRIAAGGSPFPGIYVPGMPPSGVGFPMNHSNNLRAMNEMNPTMNFPQHPFANSFHPIAPMPHLGMSYMSGGLSLSRLQESVTGFRGGGRGTAFDTVASAPSETIHENRSKVAPDLTRRLDDAILTEVFRWIGDGSYRMVAATDRRFRKIYRRIGKRTSAEQLVQTTVGAEIFLKEAKDFLFRLFREPIIEAMYFDALEFITDMAALHGSLDVLKWTRAKTSSFYNTFSLAASNGHLHVVEWLLELGCVRHDSKAFDGAAYNGHLPVLQWAKEHGYDCGQWRSACTLAARGGHLELLQWLRAQGCPWSVFTCAMAASNGHLDVLKWARANDCPLDERTCVAAAEHGDLEVLKWVLDHGCPWYRFTCDVAARHGHLEVLQLARANDCPWDEVTCAKAARHGHFDLLKWARANGCPWDSDTCLAAARGEHWELLEWAVANGCPKFEVSELDREWDPDDRYF